ncbi:hypothetical protein CSB20_07105, partial [bacterium DOLZORAL124_64_63]
MSLTRRQFIKRVAALTAAGYVGMNLPFDE